MQRLIADLGARPQAIDAADHDRLMATVSHLPHVLANVLVGQATDALAADEADRLPEVGPSFRDATRVAGANPAIWGDIFAGNSEAVAAEVDAVAERLRRAAELLRSGDRDALRAWHREAGEGRRDLLEGELAGGRLCELRVLVPNSPGVVAEIALALGPRGRQHRGHGPLSGRRHALGRDLAVRRRRGRGRARGRPRSRAGARSQPRRAMRFEPARGLRGELRPPPDKSISHRAALIGAMADGSTRISGYLDSADTRSTLAAAAQLGAVVSEGDADGHGGLFVEVQGAGLRGAAPASIDVGNAGTLLRILPGWLAGQGEGEWTLDGDESIRSRPVDRIAAPLTEMGAAVECREQRLPPLNVRGSKLRGIDYRMPIASAQVKSCLLFAGLLADGATTVREAQPSRDHSERMLAAAGAQISRDDGAITVQPAERLEAGDVAVPGDFSSAAFFIAAALIVPGSEVSLREVGINRSRIGLLSILARMGVEMGGAHEADRAMVIQEIREPGPEPMASLRVRSAPLRGAEVGSEDVPGAIDELPLVALLGCFAEGETVVSGAEELRRKESDRIDAVVDGPGCARSRDRGAARRLRRHRHGRPARRHHRRPRRPPHGDARRGRRPRLARGGRGRGLRGGLGQLPGFEADLAELTD